MELGTLLAIFFSKQASMNWYCSKVLLGSSLIKQTRVFLGVILFYTKCLLIIHVVRVRLLC